MEIQFTGHNFDVTPALREFTANKFKRLFKHAERITSVHVSLGINKLNNIAEATVHLPGTEIYAKSESDNMNKSILSLVDKLLRRISKYKQKSNHHR